MGIVNLSRVLLKTSFSSFQRILIRSLPLRLMIRIGIFFGGASREREISFAGGRTVYDNLDKNLFEPVPIFVDSKGNFILLNWQFIYKGTIRDFYPPVASLPPSAHSFQLYLESLGDIAPETLNEIISKVGKRLSINDLSGLIDFGFLALHGAGGEDGSIQGILEWLHIPYSGSGILPSSIGMNKVFQKSMMKKAGLQVARSMVIKRREWLQQADVKKIFRQAQNKIGLPLVVRPANQGSSIGVTIVKGRKEQTFMQAVDAAFFIRRLPANEWKKLSSEEQIIWVAGFSEIKDGTGIPCVIGNTLVYHPDELLKYIRNHFNTSGEELLLQSIYEEQEVQLEAFIDGTEFSCIVIRNEEDQPVALPPTEIRKGSEVFDYRSKYLPGQTRKVTPINLPKTDIGRIRKDCEALFRFFGFHVYARIDGFIRKDKKIFLNDPNTTSGMLPSSFFFHQAAEIGLNPSQFLTYIIRTSIAERIQSQSHTIGLRLLLLLLDEKISGLKNQSESKKKVAVILGGYSSERHISVESGRNIFEKLAASTKYEPIPVFLAGDEKEYALYQIPVNLLLKDNADDIREKILHFKKHPVVERIRKQCRHLTQKYALPTVVFEPVPLTLPELKEQVDAVFIALHGRPGEDGQLQAELDKLGIPYNGSGVASSQITINKYQTNEILRQNGFLVAAHLQLNKEDWQLDKNKFYDGILSSVTYPFICKPVDDGCSSAVKKIKSREELDAFCELLFRDKEPYPKKFAVTLGLKPGEEFPRKRQLLVEELITRNGASHFLEITGGMLTKMNGKGEPEFEVFEPSEALAGEEVLSLEEKFLAGQGQNITPARFAKDSEGYKRIAAIVKSDLERVARILQVSGYCRIDAFVRIFDDGRVETIIIEVNSLPGMTPATVIFHQAAINQYKPFDFIDKILEFSLEKHRIKSAR